MLSRSVFEMPFCIITSVNICVIKTVSYVLAKGCVIVLSPGRGFWAFSHVTFYPEGRSFAALFAQEWGFGFLKNSHYSVGHIASRSRSFAIRN